VPASLPARLIAAALVALLMTGCCSMSRRPIPGICAIEAAQDA
jgi:hypothetical protein